MPKLLEIVNEINADLLAAECAVLNKGTYYPIAKTTPRYPENGPVEYLPLVITDTDQEDQTIVIVDDTKPLIIYHKTKNITAIPDKSQYGHGYDRWTEKADMEMIVYGDRAQLNITEEDLFSTIVSLMPVQMEKSFLTTNNLRQVTISSVGPNFNSMAVYLQEYKQQIYPLKPNSLYFSINYKVETRYIRSCVATC